MKISSKGKYGLLLMLDLAMYDSGSFISLMDVSDRTGVTPKYLEQIVSALSRAGLVHSQRGTRGGYRLAKPAEEITSGDILRALEGPLHPGPEEGDPLQNYWDGLNRVIDAYADGITLAQLAASRQELVGNDYCI